ncbi:MAG: shikimate dehydrogenase [Fuerstiella sp.]|nr:shikimate dehydrogenase [Fuerstiella sp.]
MRAQHEELAEQKAELVELRLDWMHTRPDVGRLLRDRPTPVVITCRRQQDRGQWTGTEEQRRSILREAIALGAEYVDLEIDIAGSVERYGDTQRIVSFHNFEETPPDLHQIYSEMTKCDPDVIKIVTMANSQEDNVRMLQLVQQATVPTVGFCMGEFGIASRLLCGKFGSPFTYAGFSRSREMAPGQLTFAEVRNMYRFNRITDRTRIFAVVGDPIAHSMSPLLHNAAFRKVGYDAVYLPLRIPEGALETTLNDLNPLNFSGFSVTIPHKQEAVQVADVLDAAVDEIGAANTLFKHGAEWQATNTDCDAIEQTVIDGLKKLPNRTPEIADKRVLVLGAGGAARAAVQAMLHHGARVVISNRSPTRGQQLAGEMECMFLQWENRSIEEYDVLINCTPVGMYPEVDETPFFDHWMRESTLVFDTVYNPENTLLLKQARERGCVTASGVEMFVRQAARQFEIFTGQAAPREYMEETMRRAMTVGSR